MAGSGPAQRAVRNVASLASPSATPQPSASRRHRVSLPSQLACSLPRMRLAPAGMPASREPTPLTWSLALSLTPFASTPQSPCVYHHALLHISTRPRLPFSPNQASRLARPHFPLPLRPCARARPQISALSSPARPGWAAPRAIPQRPLGVCTKLAAVPPRAHTYACTSRLHVLGRRPLCPSVHLGSHPPTHPQPPRCDLITRAIGHGHGHGGPASARPGANHIHIHVLSLGVRRRRRRRWPGSRCSQSHLHLQNKAPSSPCHLYRRLDHDAPSTLVPSTLARSTELNFWGPEY
ncbi:hypothetical protein C8Q79DRAFT_362213 [Trametes meyenii]|nr:hypothetical protein C8Q79DRAFT_362213 [Trametes meyenii]